LIAFGEREERFRILWKISEKKTKHEREILWPGRLNGV